MTFPMFSDQKLTPDPEPQTDSWCSPDSCPKWIPGSDKTDSLSPQSPMNVFPWSHELQESEDKDNGWLSYISSMPEQELALDMC